MRLVGQAVTVSSHSGTASRITLGRTRSPAEILVGRAVMMLLRLIRRTAVVVPLSSPIDRHFVD
jgi:hypothetical protein